MKNFRDNNAGGFDRPRKPFGKGNFGNRPFGGGNRSFGSQGGEKREMFDATCSTCGKDCKIPFRPSAGRAVFCSNCFDREGGGSAPRFGGNNFSKPSFEDKKMFQATCGKCGTTCEVPFRPLAGKPVFCNNCFDKGGVNANKSIENLKEQLDQLNEKLDRILIALLPAESKAAVLKKEEAIGKKKTKEKEIDAEPKAVAKKPAAKTKKKK